MAIWASSSNDGGVVRIGKCLSRHLPLPRHKNIQFHGGRRKHSEFHAFIDRREQLAKMLSQFLILTERCSAFGSLSGVQSCPVDEGRLSLFGAPETTSRSIPKPGRLCADI